MARLTDDEVREAVRLLREEGWLPASWRARLFPDDEPAGEAVARSDEAERRVAEGEERLRTLINAMPDIVCFKDGAGRWLEANDFDRWLFQLEGVDYRGRKDSDLAAFSPFYRDAFLTCEDTDEEAWRTRVPSRGDEVIPRPDGTKMVFDVIKVPTFHADGSRKGLVVIGRDVTEHRRAEAERARVERRMLQAQKLESLGILAGGIAHDFNNLLMGILGNADLARSDLERRQPDEVEAHLGGIDRAARRAAELCQQLLAYAGRAKFVRAPLDLAAVVRETAQLVSVSVRPNTTVAFALSPDVPPIEGDPNQIRQVAMNLVINAADAIGEAPGTIRVAIDHRAFDAPSLQRAVVSQELPPGRYVALDVTDDGCGMDEETRTRIFDPFYSTKPSGRGLGLAAVLGIVRAHRGALLVDSAPGRGTSFTVLFPPGVRRPDDVEGAPAPALEPAQVGPVLVVDDEADVREVASLYLTRAGFAVKTAADGAEAVARFSAAPTAVSCILLDLSMPRMSGVEAYQALRAIRRDVPILLTSGFSEDEVTGCCEGGPVAFIQKPYGSRELVRAVTELVATSAAAAAAAP